APRVRRDEGRGRQARRDTREYSRQAKRRFLSQRTWQIDVGELRHGPVGRRTKIQSRKNPRSARRVLERSQYRRDGGGIEPVSREGRACRRFPRTGRTDVS